MAEPHEEHDEEPDDALETLPPYDQGTDLDDLADFPPLDREAFVASAVLRPAEEIEQARDLAELWHWRSRTRRLVQEGPPLEPYPNPTPIARRSAPTTTSCG